MLLSVHRNLTLLITPNNEPIEMMIRVNKKNDVL